MMRNIGRKPRWKDVLEEVKKSLQNEAWICGVTSERGVQATGNPPETFVLPGPRRWKVAPAEARCSPVARKSTRSGAGVHRLFKEAFALTRRVQLEEMQCQ